MSGILYVFLPCKKVYPLGAAYLADFLHRERPNVAQRILDLSILPKPRRERALAETIASFDPELIAFTWRDVQVFAPHEGDDSLKYAFDFYYSPNPLRRAVASAKGLGYLWTYYRNLMENFGYFRQVARNFPSKRMAVGGGAFSVFAEQIIERLPEGVIGIIGEGEDALLDIWDGRDLSRHRSIRRGGGAILKGAQQAPVALDSAVVDLDYIESIFPQHAAYHAEPIGIQTKRGCPYDCQFCLYTYIEGKRVYIRPAALVVEEIRRYYDRWGARRFWFADAQWIPGSKYYPICEETLERIIASGMKMEWGAYIRTSLITPKLARLMADSGLGDTEVSITSGSQRVLDELKMGFQLEKLYEGCRYLKEAGFSGRIILNYSLNSPGETEETLSESIESYKKIAAIMGEDRVFPALFFLGVQPHTGLEERLLEEGYLKAGYNPFSLNPVTIKKMLYNPAPLNKIIAKACLAAWEKAYPTAKTTQTIYADDSLGAVMGRENSGRVALLNLEKELALRR